MVSIVPILGASVFIEGTAMLESLVSSRIRRALLEHILRYPDERFYLRGLAKVLGVPTTPLRRELKRFEQLGLLKAYNEANIRFYVVDQHSPLFLQLKSAQVAIAPSIGESAHSAPAEAIPVVPSVPLLPRVQPAIAPAAPQLDTERLQKPQGARPVRRWSMGLGLMSAALLLLLVLGGLLYVAATHHQLLSVIANAVRTPQAQVTVVESPEARPTGEMRGARWRLLPGAVGGFSSGAGEASY